jgi:hypothetical protein
MDPLTALAAIKTGVAAGKQLHNLSKEIAGFLMPQMVPRKPTLKRRTASLRQLMKRPWRRGHKRRMQRQLKLKSVSLSSTSKGSLPSGAAEDTP